MILNLFRAIRSIGSPLSLPWSTLDNDKQKVTPKFCGNFNLFGLDNQKAVFYLTPSAFQLHIVDLDYSFYLSYCIVYVCQVDAVGLHDRLECCDLRLLPTRTQAASSKLILHYLQDRTSSLEASWTLSCIPLQWIYGQGPTTYSHILGLSLKHIKS
jgi:hypothetical protein